MNKDDKGLSFPISVADYLGFAINPLDKGNHVEPRSDMRLNAKSKKLLNGGSLKKGSVIVQGLLHELFIDKFKGTYPAYPAEDYLLADRNADLAESVSYRWADLLESSRLKSSASLPKAFHLLTGAAYSIYEHRLRVNPKEFDSLWPGKMLTRLTSRFQGILKSQAVSEENTTDRIKLILNNLSEPSEGALWHQHLVKQGRIEELRYLVLAAHTVKLHYDEYDDLCFESLWLTAYMLNNLEIFVLSAYKLQLAISEEKYPFYNHDVVQFYFEFLAERNHSGFTNYQTISHALVFLSQARTHGEFSFDDPLTEAWGKLLDLKHLFANVDDELIQEQLAIGYFEGLIAKLEKEQANCEMVDASRLEEALNALSVVFNDGRLRFKTSGIPGENFAFDWLNRAEELIDRVTYCRKKLVNALTKKNIDTINIKRLSDDFDPFCDESFETLKEAREELKETTQNCDSFDANFNTACSALLKHTELLKEHAAAALAAQSQAEEAVEEDIEAAQALEIDELRKTIKELKHNEYRLRVQLSQHDSKASAASDTGEANEDVVMLPLEQLATVFASRTPLEGTLRAIIAMYPDCCEVSPAAWRSVSQNKAFDRLVSFINQIRTLLSEEFLAEYSQKGSSAAFNFFTKSELALSESEATMRSYPGSRTFEFDDGIQRVCDKHLKLGVSGSKQHMLRVYFEIENGKVYIGEITDHLPTSTKS